MFETPVLLVMYNRYEYTMEVFKAIREIQPKYLYIAADGPKPDKPKDKIKCEKLRNKIVESVDWDCELKTLFHDNNNGCGYCISGALKWFFENVEEGIFVEDDCVPNKSFFYFCQKMLEYYRDDNRIAMISGTTFLPPEFENDYTYYFSRSMTAWGWATWRRVWDNFDIKFKDLDAAKKEGYFECLYPEGNIADYSYKFLSGLREGHKDFWDVQWVYYCTLNHMLSIAPIKNMISNIGESGLNFKSAKNSPSLHRATFEIDTDNIKHPPYMVRNSALDLLAGQTRYPKLTLRQRWKNYRRNKLLQIKIRPNEKIIKVFGKYLLKIEAENNDD